MSAAHHSPALTGTTQWPRNTISTGPETQYSVVPRGPNTHPKDDYLVALARDAAVDAITSGDDDLHAARDLGIEVLTPRDLLTRLGL